MRRCGSVRALLVLGYGSTTRRILCGRADCGQSTVEYAIVLLAVLAVLGGLAALWHLFGSGRALEALVSSLTHRLPGGAIDAALY